MERQSRPEDAETSPGGPREDLPQRIGVYRVECRLGRGGMGEVFLAWDERLERRVAVKRIRPDSGLSPEQRERFRREARLAARLSHPAIVQIHDLVTEGADDAIVMEYVEGRTLAERIAGGRIETAEALRLAREIATGLAAAHEAGLIHRDLKAANVIVTRAGQAKILDFGLARPSGKSEETPLTRRGMVVGTLGSMSPEQVRGQELDERSDLFSLGILLYEMLTGHRPFRGRDSAEVLWQVVHEPPPSPRSLQPDLPAAAESLLDRLLAKDREKRPGKAREVIAILDRIAAGADQPTRGDDSVSELPTAQMPTPRAAVPPLPPRKGTPPSSLVGPLGRSPRLLWIAAVVAALIATVATTVLLKQPSRVPLRIAISPIEVVPAGDERLALAGSGVLTAAISGLTALEGIAPIDPRESERGGRSPVDVARATAANEVLTSEIRREGSVGRVTLRRLQGNDGRVLWTDTLQVPIGAGDLRVLADAVANKIRHAYRGHDLLPGAPELDVRDADYAAFLEIAQRIDTGAVPLEPELGQVEAILRTSPRFPEAQFLAARLSLSLFLSKREAADLDRATKLVRQARDLAPDDPRPLRQEIQIALAANRTDDAAAILARLDRLLPGDPEVLPLRASLAEQQGRPKEALALFAAAAERAPSWQNVYWLAEAEARQGRIATARPRLETIVREAPHNLWAREALAHLELVYGDLARAERLYLECSGTSPRRALNNLGLARSLRGRFQEAADAYTRALALQPNRVFTLISLADSQVDLGRTPEAEALYRRALALLEANAALGGPREAMLKAQCLVRLGRSREAVATAQAALYRHPDDPDLLYQSAVVLSLAGDRSSALNNALAALSKGVQPRWFSRPALRWLREVPEMRPYLAPVTSSAAPPGASSGDPPGVSSGAPPGS